MDYHQAEEEFGNREFDNPDDQAEHDGNLRQEPAFWSRPEPDYDDLEETSSLPDERPKQIKSPSHTPKQLQRYSPRRITALVTQTKV